MSSRSSYAHAKLKLAFFVLESGINALFFYGQTIKYRLGVRHFVLSRISDECVSGAQLIGNLEPL